MDSKWISLQNYNLKQHVFIHCSLCAFIPLPSISDLKRQDWSSSNSVKAALPWFLCKVNKINKRQLCTSGNHYAKGFWEYYNHKCEAGVTRNPQWDCSSINQGLLLLPLQPGPVLCVVPTLHAIPNAIFLMVVELLASCSSRLGCLGRTFTRCSVTVGLKHFRLRDQGMVINPFCLLPQNKEDRKNIYEELGDIFITLHGGL